MSGDYIRLTNGNKFFFHDLEKSDICIQNIAKPLAKLCRFNGQTPGWNHYSIAEHAINVSKLVPKKYRFCALMHDAAEAFLGDVTTPLKRNLPQYKTIEMKWDDFIAQSYGYQYPFPPEVKKADYEMCVLEYHTFFKDVWKFNPEVDTDLICTSTPINPALIKFEYWPPRLAYEAFMERYIELGGKLEYIWLN